MATTHIDWIGPLAVAEVLGLNGANDYGIYQIYGKHVVFGSNALVYIGKADRQTFGTRFKQHLKWLEYEERVEVHLGRIREGDYEVDARWTAWSQLTSDAEALLIYQHSPPYNSKNIARYAGRTPDLKIENAGSRRRLLHLCPAPASAPVARPDDTEER